MRGKTLDFGKAQAAAAPRVDIAEMARLRKEQERCEKLQCQIPDNDFTRTFNNLRGHQVLLWLDFDPTNEQYPFLIITVTRVNGYLARNISAYEEISQALKVFKAYTEDKAQDFLNLAEKQIKESGLNKKDNILNPLQNGKR